jgi:hypothetical protein
MLDANGVANISRQISPQQVLNPLGICRSEIHEFFQSCSVRVLDGVFGIASISAFVIFPASISRNCDRLRDLSLAQSPSPGGALANTQKQSGSALRQAQLFDGGAVLLGGHCCPIWPIYPGLLPAKATPEVNPQ